MARAFECGGDHALVLGTGASASRRQDLRVRAHEPADELSVLVVDEGDFLRAEQARFTYIVGWCWHRSEMSYYFIVVSF